MRIYPRSSSPRQLWLIVVIFLQSAKALEPPPSSLAEVDAEALKLPPPSLGEVYTKALGLTPPSLVDVDAKALELPPPSLAEVDAKALKLSPLYHQGRARTPPGVSLPLPPQ